MFSLTCAWMNYWVNNREAGDLRRHHAHFDVTVMVQWSLENVIDQTLLFSKQVWRFPAFHKVYSIKHVQGVVFCCCGNITTSAVELLKPISPALSFPSFSALSIYTVYLLNITLISDKCIDTCKICKCIQILTDILLNQPFLNHLPWWRQVIYYPYSPRKYHWHLRSEAHI